MVVSEIVLLVTVPSDKVPLYVCDCDPVNVWLIVTRLPNGLVVLLVVLDRLE